MFALSDILKPLTGKQVKQTAYAMLDSVGVDTTEWRPGSPLRTFFAVASELVSLVTHYVAEIARQGFLSTASGPGLDVKALEDYNITRNEATFATGPATFTNAGPTPYTIPAYAWTGASTSGKQFKNTATITIGPSPATVTVAVQAIEAGSGSSIGAGQLNTMVTQYPGLSVSNAGAMIGLDAESDTDLRTRCLESTAPLSPFGSPDSYSFAARSALRPDGTPCGVSKTKETADGFGNLTMVVATPTGPVGSPDITYVDDNVQLTAVWQGVNCTVVSATPHSINFQYTAYVYSSANLAQAVGPSYLLDPDQALKDLFSAAISQRVYATPIGGDILVSAPGKLYANSIVAAIVNALPGFVADVQLVLPAGDTTLGANEIPTVGVITGTVVLIPAPGGL